MAKKRNENVTIRLSKVTKIALDIYQAKQYANLDKYPTNDETILALLKVADPDAVAAAMKALGGVDDEGEQETK